MKPFEPKPRPCKHCGSLFTPLRAMQQVCGWVCARRFVLIQTFQAKVAQKAALKARKAELETIPELIKKAQTSFNAFIRERDRDQPCICCGKPLGDGDVGGAFDCGHYRSTGSASHLRFHEHNANGQRKHCNRYGAGRAVDYRIGLIARIGLDAVEALESDNTPRKWTREELREIRATYINRLKQLRKERA